MDFFDESIRVVESGASEHALMYTKDTRVRFRSLHQIDYPKGLNRIIEAFFDEIKTLPVLIRDFTYDHGHIYVRFEMYRQRSEVPVWHSLLRLQDKAGATCADCGGLARRHVYKSVLQVVCAECMAESARKDGATGTWVDKY